MFTMHELKVIGSVLTDVAQAPLGKTKDGTSAITLDLVVNETGKRTDGSKWERATRYRLPLYGRAAETAKAYVGQGDSIFVTGIPGTPEAWLAKDGSGVRAINVIANGRFRFAHQSQRNYAAAVAARNGSHAADEMEDAAFDDSLAEELDEVPF